jgi:carnitine O-acetyltransferase
MPFSLAQFVHILYFILDRLQYTITSRTEMPNAQFNGEIAKAAVDLYELHSSVRKSKL